MSEEGEVCDIFQLNRKSMQLLKAEGVIGVKACKAIVYKVSDVLRMYGHWNVPTPQFLYDILNKKVICHVH